MAKEKEETEMQNRQMAPVQKNGHNYGNPKTDEDW